jgi:hypothetical protein
MLRCRKLSWTGGGYFDLFSSSTSALDKERMTEIAKQGVDHVERLYTHTQYEWVPVPKGGRKEDIRLNGPLRAFTLELHLPRTISSS